MIAHHAEAPEEQSLLTPYLLMLSLSILGVFEGFAIGA